MSNPQKTNKKTEQKKPRSFDCKWWSLWKYLRLSCCKVRHQVFGVPWCFWSQNLVLLCRNLHAAMFESVLRAPMSFFQDTPQARGILEKCRLWMIPRIWNDDSILDIQLDGSLAKRVLISCVRESFPNTSLAFEHFNRNSLRRIVFTCLPVFSLVGQGYAQGIPLRKTTDCIQLVVSIALASGPHHQ